jgi:hypothetical protein
MRFYEVRHVEGKLYVVAEAIGDLADDDTFTDPADELRNREDVRSREELEATSIGRRALARWRGGDDSAHERETRERLRRETAEDEARMAKIAAMSPADHDARARAEGRRVGMSAETVEELIERDHERRRRERRHLTPVR